MSVGIVLVSHSPALAQATVDFAQQMVTSKAPKIVIAAGDATGGCGTNFPGIMAAITEANTGDGVVILADIGSAILTTDTALEFLGYPDDVVLAAAPLCEGALAAIVSATTGAPLAAVVDSAQTALDAKIAHLATTPAESCPTVSSPTAAGSAGQLSQYVTVQLADGLHARTASHLPQLIADLDADVTLSFADQNVSISNLLDVVSLRISVGDSVQLQATGPQAQQAMTALADYLAQSDAC